MINERLIFWARPGVSVAGKKQMTKELLAAAFSIGVGLCVAGAGTHLYQWLTQQTAALRYDGKTWLSSLGNLMISFICGPYIMLQTGWQTEEDGTISTTSALVSAAVAFSWSFLTGLLILGGFVLLRY